jgi:hypothetical protein
MRVCIHSGKVKKGEKGRMWKNEVKNGGNNSNNNNNNSNSNSSRSLEKLFLKTLWRDHYRVSEALDKRTMITYR